MIPLFPLPPDRILLLDGAMGTSLKRMNLPPEAWAGYPSCSEILNLSRPDAVFRVHQEYIEAGSRLIETNSFGGAAHILAEHGLEERTEEINQEAALIARRAVRDSSRECWVVGSMGPGSLLPSLGQVAPSLLEESYRRQALGLLRGEVDALLIETCQDLLQAKTALRGALKAMDELGLTRPLLVSFTLDLTGRTLTGSDPSSIAAALEPLPVQALGFNCGFGPDRLLSPLAQLAELWPRALFLMPNAGLPEVREGKTVYSLTPEQFGAQMRQAALSSGLSFAGGCCGTTPDHIRALAQALEGVPPRKASSVPASLGSLFTSQGIDTHPKPLLIGERTNASGSKAFRETLLKKDFEGMLSLAKEQERDKPHLMDLSLASAGEDETLLMESFTPLLNGNISLPVMVDSTRPEAVERALENLAGRCVVNSINLEDGGAKALRVFKLCRLYGAALVCLTIDRQGMAMTKERKVEVAREIYRMALDQGLRPQDLFFDPLTFSLCSGDASLEKAGWETLQALSMIKEACPGSWTILGVSNVSYGLPPALRRVLNSLFLHVAVEKGLDAAIVHAGQLLPLHRIPDSLRDVCDDLIHGRRREGVRALDRLLEKTAPTLSNEPEGPEENDNEKLTRRIIDGDKAGMEPILEKLLESALPWDILQNTLLPAMDRVGKLFGEGKMLLPFVLRSAETLARASEILKPKLGAGEGEARGRLILATVRGDIHDIGKNLVDSIFSANGYKVFNLGVKQSPEEILASFKKNGGEAIGLSGLLVESARSMVEYVSLFHKEGLEIPILCGGAALSPRFVERELSPFYRGRVVYCCDAMDGLDSMKGLSKGEVRVSLAGTPERPPQVRETKRERLPEPVRTLHVAPAPELLATGINKERLFKQRWLRNPEDPELPLLLDDLVQKEGVLWKPRILQARFSAMLKGETLALTALNGCNVDLRLSTRGSEALRRRHGGRTFPLVLQVVSLGWAPTKALGRLHREKRWEREFFLHGLAAELTELLALHGQRSAASYLGPGTLHRWSPGYPLWPDLSQQRILFALLRPEREGIRLTEGDQIEPEFSTSALIFPEPHPL